MRTPKVRRQPNRADRRLFDLLADARDVVLVLKAGVIELAVGGDALGFSAASLVGLSAAAAIPLADAMALDRVRVQSMDATDHRGRENGLELSLPDGRMRWVDLVVADRRTQPSIEGFVVTVHDVTDRHELVATLASQAANDAVTGLPNRSRFLQLLEAAVARARRTGEHLAVMCADLDEFATVIDAFGHSAGDEVLRESAARLRGALRTEDVVGRIADDRFAVLVAGLEAHIGRGYAVDVADRVATAMAQPILLSNGEQEHRLVLGMHIGIAHRGKGAADPSAEELLDEAQTSSDEVKRNSRRWRDLHV